MQSKRTVGLPSRNARKGENKSISDLEWTMTWMSLRYAMNGQTIATGTLPQELVKAYYNRWTKNQKATITRECKRNEEDVLEWTGGKSKAFGHETIDRPGWLKFWASCDIEKHYKVKLIDNKTYTVFEANGRIYPLDDYVKEPHREIYCIKEDILKSHKNEDSKSIKNI